MTAAVSIKQITSEVQDHLKPILALLSDVAGDIHAHPEIRFTEVHAADRLTKELEQEGFQVQRGFGGLDTAFVARWSTSTADESSPTVAIFCEYDALEEIGHACGHNVIAACGLGAGFLTKRALDSENDCPANLVVIGSPGEEGAAGKVPMIEAGVLEGIDFAIMIHPNGEDTVGGTSMSRVALDIDFAGKASHAAAAPELGRNALDAAVLSLNAIGLLRQQLKEEVRIHAIITNGGQAPNIIPERTALRAFVRGIDSNYLLDNVVPRVQRCIEGAAHATECDFTIKQNTPAYQSLLSNSVLTDLAEAAFQAVGRNPERTDAAEGSTDMGNVSQVVPAIHPMICLSDGLTPHTREFAAAAGGTEAEKTIADGAVILASVALRVLRDPETIAAAKETFAAAKNGIPMDTKNMDFKHSNVTTEGGSHDNS